MAIVQRTLNETYNYITVFLSLDGTAAAKDTLLDADTLSFYDINVPSSSDIEIRFCSAHFNLSGRGDSTAASGGEVTFWQNHNTTDTEVITLTGNGSLSLSPSLGRQTTHPSGDTITGFNGDVLYSVEEHTVGHVTVVFEKKSGYYMSFNKFRKPTQANPYSS